MAFGNLDNNSSHDSNRRKQAGRPLGLKPRSLTFEKLEDLTMMDASSMEYTDVPDTMDTTAAEISHALVNSGDSGNFNQGVITPEGEGEASGPSYEDLQHLYDVQQKYGFQLNRSYYFNEFGHQDKALYGADVKWYQIRPDGSIWESAGTCILKEQVHPDAYTDPERYLFNAEPPLAPEVVDAIFSDPQSLNEVLNSESVVENFDPVRAQVESIETITPSFTVTAEGNKLVLHYENAPSGLRWDITNPGSTNGTYIESRIPEGSGTLLMGVPNDGDRTLTVIITNTLNDERLGPWVSFNAGSGIITQPPTATSFSLPALAYERVVTSTELSPLAPEVVDAVFSEIGEVESLDTEESAVQQQDAYTLDGSSSYSIARESLSITINLPSEQNYSAIPSGGHELAAWVYDKIGYNGHFEQVGADRDNAIYFHDRNSIWKAVINGRVYVFPDDPSGNGDWLQKKAFAQLPTMYDNPDNFIFARQRAGDAVARMPSLSVQNDVLTVTLPDDAQEDEEFRIVLISDSGEEQEILFHVGDRTGPDASVMGPLQALTLETAEAEEDPTFFLELQGDRGFLFHYRNVTTDTMLMIVVPRGGSPYGTTFFEKKVSQGDGSIPYGVTMENRPIDAEVVFFNMDSGEEIGGRLPFSFENGHFTNAPVAIKPVAEMTYEELSLAHPQLMEAFRSRVLENVWRQLPSLPSARDLAARVNGSVFGATPELDDARIIEMADQNAREGNSFDYHDNFIIYQRWAKEAQDQVVSGAWEGIGLAEQKVRGMAHAAFSSVLREKTGQGALSLAEITAAGKLRDDREMIVAQFVGSFMHSAESILAIVKKDFDALYQSYVALAERDQALTALQNEAADASSPKPELTSQERIDRLLLANPGLVVAWNNMGYDGQRLMDVRLQGFDQNQAIALIQQGAELVASAGGNEIESEGASVTENLGTIQRLTDPYKVNFSPNGTAVLKFHIDQISMASFWANPGDVSALVPLDLSLTISGSNLAEAYRSDKGTGSGESISLKLTPGDYVLTLKDETNYANFPITPEQRQNMDIPEFPLGMNVQPYDSRKIEGQISTAERPMSMPVSMSVAEFDLNSGKRLDLAKNKLDPNKPVWVIIHGRGDSPDSTQMTELARNLSSGQQVVTIDWNKASSDFIKIPSLISSDEHDFGDLRDASWTPAVGQWIARQLLAVGFSPSLINTAVHSHGSYVAYFMGEEIVHLKEGEQINSLVALDPAINPWFANNTISESDIQLDEVATNSWAFVSSMFGSKEIADTAEFYIEVDSADRNSLDLLNDARKAHGYAVTLFSDLIARQGNVDARFTLSSIMEGENITGMERHRGYEGKISVNLFDAVDANGSLWRKARYNVFADTENWTEGQQSGENS